MIDEKRTTLTVCVVDDDPGDLEVFRRHAKGIPAWDLDLRTFDNFPAAARAMEEDRAQVLVLDYHLGDTNGMDIVRSLRARGETLPIILLTGLGDEQVATQAIRDGADDYLTKGGLSPDAVRRSLATALAQAALREEKARQATRLAQTQRLESLGRLAGGVAHDMNNVLTAILANAEARLACLEAQDPSTKAFETIAVACHRGAGIVASLLAFARNRLDVVGPVDLNRVVRDIVRLLSLSALGRVSLRLDLQEPLDPVLGDESALGNVLMNLCLNAVDAMPDGGVLVLATQGLAGDCQSLTVRDSGCGMSPEVLGKAIDPFYSTKPMGKGTGLGLSMAYSTMQAHRGTLEIQSAPDQGTMVILEFPVLHLSGPAPEPDSPGPREEGLCSPL